MKVSERNYPFPVLAEWQDDIQPFCMNCDIDVTFDRTYYYFNYKLALQNKTILELLKSGRASFVLHIECSSTFFRQVFRVIPTPDKAELIGTIDIPADDLIGRTEVSVFICADENITAYMPEGMHPDYEQRGFTLINGNYIAVWGMFKFDLFKNYDPIRNISSIIEFCKDEETLQGPMQVNFDKQKLQAILPKLLYESYVSIKDDPTHRQIISSMLILPILMEGLSYIRSIRDHGDEGQLSDCRNQRWFRSLEKKMLDMNWDIMSETAFEIAQKIMELPYPRASQELLKSMTEE